MRTNRRICRKILKAIEESQRPRRHWKRSTLRRVALKYIGNRESDIRDFIAGRYAIARDGSAWYQQEGGPQIPFHYYFLRIFGAPTVETPEQTEFKEFVRKIQQAGEIGVTVDW